MDRFQIDEARLEAALSRGWPELAAFWPVVLADFLAAIGSPADPAEVAAGLAGEKNLTGLARRWNRLDQNQRRQAWLSLAERLTQAAYATRPYCLKCGQCCQKGSPAFLPDDLPLIQDGPLKGRLYTIRAGEPVKDERAGQFRAVRRERVKLMEQDGACCFYESETGCLIYGQRPAQCRLLECWNPQAWAALEAGPFLDRRQILAGDSRRLDYLTTHAARCPAEGLLELAFQARTDSLARDKLTDRVGFDLHVRSFAVEKGDLTPGGLDLVLGRPLAVILSPLGW
ncbi:MAG: YkgJ family cysteine cluster protein, partial [Deltaproteobacteria bacterium]|nr:YkgJ family cysteine cluster protein [Deltaproteobacteria bacterium]